MRDHPLFPFRQLDTGKVASFAASNTGGIVTVQLEVSLKEYTENKACVGTYFPHARLVFGSFWIGLSRQPKTLHNQELNYAC